MNRRDVSTNQRFRLLDMFVSKEELTIQVAQIDSVKINDVNFAEAGEDEVLQ